MPEHERMQMPDYTDEEVRSKELTERINFFKEKLAADRPGIDPGKLQNMAALMAVFDIGFQIRRYDLEG